MSARGPLRFAGYAALFDIADAGRDTIRRGAFARTLAARDQPLPLFWQHRPDQPIGVIEQAAEDARGLRVIARIDRPDSRAAHLLTAGHVTGLSFGFLWQPGLVEGQPDRLLGYPVVEAEDMPDVAAGTFPIAFGNFRSGYLISERGATQVLRDPFTNKPFVHFYATKRIGGKVLDSNAIKLLKIEA